MRRLNVLLLCDRYPFPLENGQNLRIHHYVTQLNARHDFDLLCYADGPPVDSVRSLFRRIERFKKPSVARAYGPGRLVESFSVKRVMPSSEEVIRHLDDAIGRRKYDLLWVSGWGMIVNLPVGLPAPLLADMVDDGVLEFWRELPNSRSSRGVVRNLKSLLMNYLFERRYFRSADECVFVSEVDARVFSHICPTTPTSVVHNGVDAEFYKPLGLSKDRNTVIFEGKIGFRPNAEGIEHFVTDVFPLVRSEVPDVRLLIVGKDPPDAVRAFASDHIEVTGYVDDVRPFIDRASVFVCPLRTGAGIKNKVLQAWAMEKAVVATTASVGGLRVRESENIIVRDSDKGFANAVINLLRNPNTARRLGTAGRETILDHYTWSSKAEELESIMLRISGKASRASADA